LRVSLALPFERVFTGGADAEHAGGDGAVRPCSLRAVDGAVEPVPASPGSRAGICLRQASSLDLDFARNTDPAEGKSATCLRQADPQSAPRLRSGLHNIIDGAAFFSTQPGSGP